MPPPTHAMDLQSYLSDISLLRPSEVPDGTSDIHCLTWGLNQDRLTLCLTVKLTPFNTKKIKSI